MRYHAPLMPILVVTLQTAAIAVVAYNHHVWAAAAFMAVQAVVVAMSLHVAWLRGRTDVATEIHTGLAAWARCFDGNRTH